jgi:hypothetical protein
MSSTLMQASVPGSISSARATARNSFATGVDPSPRASVQTSIGVDRSVQTDARAKLVRPDGGTASGALGWYVCAVATILLAGVDVFFRGKLEALLPQHHLTTADSVDPPELVICDVSRIDPEDVADTYPEVPLLGFTNHTDTDGLRRAHAAGFDQVVAKSALDERLNELVDGLLASVD